MDHAIYLTEGEMIAALVIVLLLLTLMAIGIQGFLKSERGDDNVRHRPTKQNTDI